MGLLLILVCTAIGALAGAPIVGLIFGVVIVLGPVVVDEMDKTAARRRNARKRRR
jgi:hypothetical protein